PEANDLAGADLVLAVVGEQTYAEMKGDRKDLSLAAEDLALLEKARKPGVPVITVLLSGRPLVLGPALDASDALVAAWLPGTEGQGVADVLLGDFRPSGKLPRPWPGNPEPPGDHPLFERGFGLTYKSL